MDLRENVYLRHQLQRFMRPDAARYLNPHAARFLKPGSEKADVYPALARKYEGQPRIPEGEGGGQFTFGTSGSERPRVYITRREGVGDAGLGDGEGDSGSGFGMISTVFCWLQRVLQGSDIIRVLRLAIRRKFQK
jgi:hypothetical protein